MILINGIPARTIVQRGIELGLIVPPSEVERRRQAERRARTLAHQREAMRTLRARRRHGE